MRTIEFRVPDSNAKLRLDVWLAHQIPELSRSRIQQMIKDGYVTIPGMKIAPDTRVIPGMHVYVEIPPQPSLHIEAENIDLSFIFEDDDIIVINKPPGMVVHPAPGHFSGTLVNALLFHRPELKDTGSDTRPGIVHRLDKDTSGVMIITKNEAAMRSLANQFKHKAVTKYYLAIVSGVPQPVHGVVETLIGRHKTDRKRMQSVPIALPEAAFQLSSSPTMKKARYAKTSYVVQESFGFASLVRIQPYTGRTHQIRVHMAHIGHPVLGDKQYGRQIKKIAFDKRFMITEPARQMLHAETIAFTHPSTGQYVEFKAPIPEDMKNMLAVMRKVQNVTNNQRF